MFHHPMVTKTKSYVIYLLYTKKPQLKKKIKSTRFPVHFSTTTYKNCNSFTNVSNYHESNEDINWNLQR